jgi:hypothetical protein
MLHHPDNRFVGEDGIRFLGPVGGGAMRFRFRSFNYEKPPVSDEVGLPYYPVGRFRIYNWSRDEHRDKHISAQVRATR